MSDRRQLETLAGLAARRSDAAGRQLGESISLLRDGESRLGLLERYRDEYMKRLGDAAAGGIAGDVLRNFRDFVARLDRAVAQQRDDVAALLRGVTEQHQRWLGERRRGKSFDVLAERAEGEERIQLARRSQKTIDEIAARIAR